jgi:hypothetical protein
MKLVTNHIFKIKAKDGASVKFVPNSSQQKIIDIIQSHEKVGTKAKLIIVKGRQIGGTALLQRLPLSYVMTRPNYAAFTVAHDGESVRQIFQNHVKYSFDTLPDKFRNLYKVDRNNANQLKFENAECFNSSMTVGQSARSNTIDFLHVSEASKIAKDRAKWQELITGSFEAAGNGHIILETTAGGFDAFYDFVMENKSDPKSGWQVLFLCWTDSKEYRIKAPDDDSWKIEYRELAKKYKLELKPQSKFGLDDDQLYFYLSKVKTLKEQVKAEYPLSLEEAFVSSSDSLFDIEDIVELDRTKRDYELVTGVKIYQKPIAGRRYSVGVDPSTGEGSDDGAITVIDYETREQVASISGKQTPEELAVCAVLLGYHYNNALITCETNGNGIATMNEIKKLEYPEDKLFKRYVIDTTSQRDSRIPKFGFATTGKNRPIMISELRQAIENKEQKINCPQTLQQMKTFVRKKNGRIEHEDGYHDDCIFALMLANEGCKYITQYL